MCSAWLHSMGAAQRWCWLLLSAISYAHRQPWWHQAQPGSLVATLCCTYCAHLPVFFASAFHLICVTYCSIVICLPILSCSISTETGCVTLLFDASRTFFLKACPGIGPFLARAGAIQRKPRPHSGMMRRQLAGGLGSQPGTVRCTVCTPQSTVSTCIIRTRLRRGVPGGPPPSLRRQAEPCSLSV